MPSRARVELDSSGNHSHSRYEGFLAPLRMVALAYDVEFASLVWHVDWRTDVDALVIHTDSWVSASSFRERGLAW